LTALGEIVTSTYIFKDDMNVKELELILCQMTGKRDNKTLTKVLVKWKY